MHVEVPRIALASHTHRTRETDEMQPPSKVAMAEFSINCAAYRATELPTDQIMARRDSSSFPGQTPDQHTVTARPCLA